MMKMATYVAERGLLLLCLVAFIIPATALKCKSCLGTKKECKSTEVTCPGSNDRCGSSITNIKSFLLKRNTVVKGCVDSTVPYRSISISAGDTVRMFTAEKICNTDLCNNETIQEPETKENDINCYSCISPGKDCNSETMKNMKCRGQENTCLDIRVLGTVGETSNVHFKGCGELSCSNNMIFSSKLSSVHVQCCNDNFCNSEIEFVEPDKTPNGVQCYSCNTLNDESCSPKDITTSQCYGSLTSCFELAGMKTGDGVPEPTLLKGCATPEMCESLLLPLLHNLKGSRVKCCNGSLCNNKLTEDNLQTSGYFPGTGNVNGHGNSSSSMGYHTGENRQNSSNVFSGSSIPGGYDNSNGSHSIPKNNGFGFGNGSGSSNASSGLNPISTGNVHSNSSYPGNYWVIPSSHNPEGYHYNSTHNGSHINQNSTTGGGFIYNQNLMSSQGKNNGTQNSSDSSNWNVYPNMPPPAVPGHYSNLGNMSNINGSNPYQTGLNWSSNGNYGYNNNMSHTFPNNSGYNTIPLPANWNISNLVNNSHFLDTLSNMTNISTAVLSQRLNGVDLSKPGNLASVLSGIPGFNQSRLSPEMQAAIFGGSYGYPSVPGFNHNMPPANGISQI
ncbi:uncharacterized protein [Pyxicephalus adspersus]|uniref:uncharacterized protein n=1 Tax=Pyxicephalus adspersus TaxID=30357 RepID=UPI003B59DF14